MTTITKNGAGQKSKANPKPAGGNADATRPDPVTGSKPTVPDGNGANPALQTGSTAGGGNTSAVTTGTETPAPTGTNGVKTDTDVDKAKNAAEAEKARKEAEAQAKKLAPFKAIAQRYAAYYPACGEFHITSDKMVFLEGDKAEAEAHQRELPKGEVITIKPE